MNLLVSKAHPSIQAKLVRQAFPRLRERIHSETILIGNLPILLIRKIKAYFSILFD